MTIGGINVMAFNINTVDKGYVNIGPLLVNDWTGLSKQNYGSGEVNGDRNTYWAGGTIVHDQDLLDVPHARASVL